MKHTINSIWLLLVLIFPIQIKAQQVNIGDDATFVKGRVEWLIRDYEQHEPVSNFTMRSEIKWGNGKVLEVDLIRNNTPHPYKNREIKYLSFNTRYIMKDGKLSRILQEYYNLSLNELKQLQNNDFINIGSYYFSHDYSIYTTIFMGKNGLATLELIKTELNKLPQNIREIIQKNKSALIKPEESNLLDFTISEKRAGIVCIGKKIPCSKIKEPYKIIKENSITIFVNGEKDTQSTYNIYKSNNDQFALISLSPLHNNETMMDISARATYKEIDRDTTNYVDVIGEINIYGRDFKTNKGIGVGSSIKQIVEAYSSYKIYYSYNSYKYIIETPDLHNVQFVINEFAFKGIKTKSDHTGIEILDKNSFDENYEITTIRIFQDRDDNDTSIYSIKDLEDVPKPVFDLNKYCNENIHCIFSSEQNSPRVILRFVVNKNGSISNCKVISSSIPECSVEAKRVISNMPNWKPGVRNNRPVRTYFTQTINFN